MRLPRLRRNQTTDGTQRFTAAWVLALSAVGVLVVGANVLSGSALDAQRQHLAEIDAVERHETAVDELDRRLDAVRDGDEDVTPDALARPLDAFEDTEAVLATALGSRWQLGPEARGVSRAVTVVINGDGEVTDVLTDQLTTYEDGVSALQDSLVETARGEVVEPRATMRSMLWATLALLVVEAFLVFRPATRRIQHTLEIRRRQAEDERLRSQKQLEMLARYDHLTGLANRMMFRDRLDHAIATAARTGNQVALMFLDLDKFKDVNDQFGHDAGDELLIEIGERLQEIARRTDTIARIGGDEFTVILEGLDSPDGAANVAEKILDSLSLPVQIGDRVAHVTASVGIAMYPTDAEETEDLLRHADIAMYQAKAGGKNTFQFSTPELRERSLARLRMIRELRAAISSEQLRLVFQPQIDLRTDQVVAAEALVRWLRPDGTEVTASEFIEVAEATDLMVPLGEWVLGEACQHAVAWQQEGAPPVRIAVNVSGRQFRQPDLPTTIATTLNESGLDPTLLELEITEGSLVEDIDGSSATLRLMKGIGVRVVIDDFGTGYSSLTHLEEFPIDALKIDGSFIAGVTGDSGDGDGVVPAAVAGLARSLGMETVAEGVETEAQLALLRRLEVDRAQGFLLSPPLEPDELDAYVRRRRLRAVGEGAAG
jgi:diguanylate cyclase (GGDEF)-like protein